MNDVSKEYKSIDSSNPFEGYFKKLVRLQVRGDNGSISGRIVDINERYLTLQHRDGRTTLVKLSSISIVTETPEGD